MVFSSLVLLTVWGLSPVLSDSRQLQHPHSLQHQYLHYQHQHPLQHQYRGQAQPNHFRQQKNLAQQRQFPAARLQQRPQRHPVVARPAVRKQRFLPRSQTYPKQQIKHLKKAAIQQTVPRILNGKRPPSISHKRPRKIVNTPLKQGIKSPQKLKTFKKTSNIVKKGDKLSKNDNLAVESSVFETKVNPSKSKSHIHHNRKPELHAPHKKQIPPVKPFKQSTVKEKTKYFKKDSSKTKAKKPSTQIKRDYQAGPPPPKFIIKQAGPSVQYGWVGHGTYAPLNIPNIFKAAGLNTKWIPEDNEIFEAGLTYPSPAQDKLLIEPIKSSPKKPYLSKIKAAIPSFTNPSKTASVSSVPTAAAPTTKAASYKTSPPKAELKIVSTASPIYKSSTFTTSASNKVYKIISTEAPTFKRSPYKTAIPSHQVSTFAPPTYIPSITFKPPPSEIIQPRAPVTIISEEPAVPPKYDNSASTLVSHEKPANPPVFETPPVSYTRILPSPGPAPVYTPEAPKAPSPSPTLSSPSTSFSFFNKKPSSKVETYGSDTIDLYAQQVSTKAPVSYTPVSSPPSATTHVPVTSSTTTYLPPSTTTFQPPSTTTYLPPSTTTFQPPSTTTYLPPSTTTFQPPSTTTYLPPSTTTFQPPSTTTYLPPSTTTHLPPPTTTSSPYTYRVSTAASTTPAPFFYGSPTPSFYNYQPSPTFYTPQKPVYQPAPSAFSSYDYSAAVPTRQESPFSQPRPQAQRLGGKPISLNEDNSQSHFVEIIEDEVVDENLQQAESVDDEDVFFIFYENEDKPVEESFDSSLDFKRFIQDEIDSPIEDSIFSASIPEEDIFNQPNEVPVFSVVEEFQKEEELKPSYPVFYDVPIKIEESGEGFDPPSEIRTIFVPIENAINVPNTFDISVGTSFGYNKNLQQESFPNFPAGLRGTYDTEDTSSTYDNPISSYDAPIAPFSQGTSFEVSPSDEITLGVYNQPEKKTVRRVRKPKTDSAAQEKNRFSYNPVETIRSSIPFGTRLEERQQYDIIKR